MKTSLIYFGSPDYSAEILDSIIKNKTVTVVGVVTTPDKPTGRKMTLAPSPVAKLAESYRLPVFKPHLLDEANLSHLKLLKPDIFLVVSYGKIIPISYLQTPKIGTFNLHFSLLPKYRGALCISEAIKNQDLTTGVTLMEMDELLDHGPVISQKIIPIDTNDNNATLTTKLTHIAEQLLVEKLPEICAQNYPKITQNENLAIFTPSHKTRSRKNAFIPFETIMAAKEGFGALKLHALIRSLNPEPGAWTEIDNQDIKIIHTLLEGEKLVIQTVQLPGKLPISWKQYLQGHSKIS